MRPHHRAYFDLTGGFCLAGSSVVVGKIIASGLPIYAAMAAGLAVALMVLLPLALAEGQLKPGTFVRSLPLLVLQAFFGIFLFRILLLNGLKTAGAAEVGVIISSTPAMTAVLSAIIIKEQISPRLVIGIVLTVAGLALIGGRGFSGTAASENQLLGDALALGAVLSESIFCVASKRLNNALSPRVTSAAVTAIALILYLPLAATSNGFARLTAINSLQIGAIVYYGAFVTAVAYILWYRGVARVPVSVAAVFSGVIPLTSVALSILVLGERPGVWLLAGCALTLVGIALASLGTSVPRAKKASVLGPPGVNISDGSILLVSTLPVEEPGELQESGEN